MALLLLLLLLLLLKDMASFSMPPRKSRPLSTPYSKAFSGNSSLTNTQATECQSSAHRRQADIRQTSKLSSLRGGLSQHDNRQHN